MVTHSLQFRKWVFLIIGGVELAVMVLLVVLAGQMPRSPQINATFEPAKVTVERAEYATELFHRALANIRKVPGSGLLVEQEWIDGLDQAKRELHAGGLQLTGFQGQMRAVCSTVARIASLLAGIAGLHGVYLILASCLGRAYSP